MWFTIGVLVSMRFTTPSLIQPFSINHLDDVDDNNSKEEEQLSHTLHLVLLQQFDLLSNLHGIVVIGLVLTQPTRFHKLALSFTPITFWL